MADLGSPGSPGTPQYFEVGGKIAIQNSPILALFKSNVKKSISWPHFVSNQMPPLAGFPNKNTVPP